MSFLVWLDWREISDKGMFFHYQTLLGWKNGMGMIEKWNKKSRDKKSLVKSSLSSRESRTIADYQVNPSINVYVDRSDYMKLAP